MADLEYIYKALRLIPEFDGNPNILTRFIRICDQLVNDLMSDKPEDQLKNLALINGILNKVTGPAARMINSNGIPENWAGIRSALINNFADQRDETSLYNDLALLTQGSNTPQEYYEKCQNLFSTVMTYVSLHETVPSTIESKRSLYKKLTLQSFLRGLRDPLGSRIRCMRPDTIEKALEFVHEEMNTLYLQQRNENVPERRSQSHHQVGAFSKNFSGLMPYAMPASRHFDNFGYSPKHFNSPSISRQYYSQQQPVPIFRPQGPQFRSPGRTQQGFDARSPNYKPQTNVCNISPSKNRSNNINPQPMSGVSHYVTKPMSNRQPWDWSKLGNPPPSNYFKTRELNFNDSCDPYDKYYENEYYLDYPDHREYYYEQPQLSDTYTVEEPDTSTVDSTPIETQNFREDPKSDTLG